MIGKPRQETTFVGFTNGLSGPVSGGNISEVERRSFAWTIEGGLDQGGKLRSFHGLIGTIGAIAKAMDDAPTGQSFDEGAGPVGRNIRKAN